jgi:hypothetical protein
MKKLLLLTAAFLTSTAGFSQTSLWLEQATGFIQDTSGVRDVYVVDTNIVWIIPYDGTGNNLTRRDFSRTLDGGMNWTTGSVPISGVWDWAGMAAINADTAWALFYNRTTSATGQLWKTMDGGANWIQQGVGLIYTDPNSFPNNVYFWNANEGVILGDQLNGVFEIYTTADGGATWDSVLSANIPPPASANENAWTSHFDVVGDTIWFDTNEGRVYRSADRGHTWTVSATSLPVPAGAAIDICFYNGTNGIARYYNDTTITNSVVTTVDGGDNWSAIFSPTGQLFGGDISDVPGTSAMMVSTGNSNFSQFVGSSYSTDGGLSWTTLETGTQRGALGIADSLTMWCGGFSATPTSGGIFKWTIIDSVPCTDPSVSPGVAMASDTAICANDTVTVTSTGVVAPVVGDYSGVSWVISTADITGSHDPLNEPSWLAAYLISFPAPDTSFRQFINDGSQIQTYGLYYWTPVVFANATAAGIPNFLNDLTLDTNCTFTGNSVPVMIYSPADCDITSVADLQSRQLSVYSSMKDAQTLDILIISASSGKASIQILDMTGRIVQGLVTHVSSGNNHELVNVAGLASGIYVVKAEINGQQTSRKFIRN